MGLLYMSSCLFVQSLKLSKRLFAAILLRLFTYVELVSNIRELKFANSLKGNTRSERAL